MTQLWGNETAFLLEDIILKGNLTLSGLKGTFYGENETVIDIDNNELTNVSSYLQNSSISSQNVTASETSLPHYPEGMLGFTAACAFIIAILGSMGNLLTIIALPMCKKLQNTNTAFVVNLAVVELCFCVLILPMNGIQFTYLQYTGTSLLTDFECIFFTVAKYTFTQAELQTIIAIGLFRAVAVGCPTFYRKFNNTKFTAVYIAFIWLYSFFIKLPTGLGIFGRYMFNHMTLKCDLSPKSVKARKISLLFEAFIPVILIILLYTYIFIMVRRSSKRVEQLAKKVAKRNSARPSVSSVVNDDPSATEDGTGEPKRRASAAQNLKKIANNLGSRFRLTRQSSTLTKNRRDMRIARSIFIIFLMLLVCSVPVSLNHGLDPFVKHPVRLLVFHILYWLQYCLNCVIYVFTNKQYRDAYSECLSKYFPSWNIPQKFSFAWEVRSTSNTPSQSYKKKQNSFSRGKGKSANIESSGAKDKQILKKEKSKKLSAIKESTRSRDSEDDASIEDINQKNEMAEITNSKKEVIGPNNSDQEVMNHSETESMDVKNDHEDGKGLERDMEKSIDDTNRTEEETQSLVKINGDFKPKDDHCDDV